MRGFGSDNHSGVHPQILENLLKHNIGHAPSYGTDTVSANCEKLFREAFGEKSSVYFVFNGTAANVLSLKSAVQSHHAILCSDLSHMNVDECGAPEFFTGAKLRALPSVNGKISLPQIKEALIRKGDQHFSQSRMISLTQPTELGTCYSLNEISEICQFARAEKMFVHVDGARLANAVHTLGTTFRAMTTDLGVDVVSFGGTKNGFMMGEAVVILNPALNEEFKFIRKQASQLPSKTRFIAAQFEAYFTNQTWKKIAEHSCQMAQYFSEKLQTVQQIQFTQKSESNAVFAIIPKAWIKPLREKYFFYVWDEKTFECRLMTSWDTTKDDIDQFVQLAKELST